MNCQRQNAKFEVEIQQLENSDFLYLMKFKRISGAPQDHKEISLSLLHTLHP